MESHANTRQYSQFLRKRADELDVELPPLGPTTRHWSKSLRAPGGTPPELATTPGRFIARLLKYGWRPLALQTLMMTISGVAGALIPWTMGNMVNGLVADGFDTYTQQQLLLFLGLVVTIAAVEALGELSGIATWFSGGLIGAWAVGHRVARAGRAAKQDEPAGDVVTAMVNDSDHLGVAFMWLPEAISATLSTVLIVVIMFRVSPPLGWLVIIGVPISVLLVTLLAGPLQKKLAVQREEQGKLTTVSTDAVSGLRVLRGIGGEDAYNARYQAQSKLVMDAGIAAASNQAALVVMRASIPQVLIAIVVGYGAYLTFDGSINVGELVAFFGYTWYLRIPIGTAAGVVSTWTRAWVGAKKLAGIYAVEPDADDSQVDRSRVLPEWSAVDLHDDMSGATIHAGTLTGVVCAVPERSANLVQRLGRISDRDTGEATANAVTANPVTANGVSLRDYPLDEVRKGIYLSESNAQVFRESLQDSIMGAEAPNASTRGVTELIYREHIENFAAEEDMLFLPEAIHDAKGLHKALWVADAADVESSLQWGLAGELAEKGRNISGGQRQRVALARAVHAEAPILLLIEPTSAVDSHTEARIVERLKEHRDDRTTVVVSASPLFLGRCDEIIVLDDQGQECARGTHEQLLAAAHRGDDAAKLYRTIIGREVSE